MPQIFKIGSYTVYFWSNEGKPLEPIHVHIAEGRATAAGTKVWITSTGKTLLAKNSADLPFKVLRSIMRMIEANSDEIISAVGRTFRRNHLLLLVLPVPFGSPGPVAGAPH